MEVATAAGSGDSGGGVSLTAMTIIAVMLGKSNCNDKKIRVTAVALRMVRSTSTIFYQQETVYTVHI